MKYYPKVVGWVGALAVLAIAVVALWPETKETVWIDTLESTDLDEIRQAADRLAASGSTRALEPLKNARRRLVETLSENEKRDFRLYGHLDFDEMMRRIWDRRQSEEGQRLWWTLGSVTRAIGVLDRTAEARRTQSDEGQRETREGGEATGGTEEGREDGESGVSQTEPGSHQ